MSISEGNSVVDKSIVCQFAEYTWVSFGHDRRVRQVTRTGDTQIQHNRLEKMVLAAKDDEEGLIDVP
jgi:hypothetical protein